jgi:hypothetical protein
MRKATIDLPFMARHALTALSQALGGGMAVQTPFSKTSPLVHPGGGVAVVVVTVVVVVVVFTGDEAATAVVVVVICIELLPFPLLVIPTAPVALLTIFPVVVVLTAAIEVDVVSITLLPNEVVCCIELDVVVPFVALVFCTVAVLVVLVVGKASHASRLIASQLPFKHALV